MPYRSFLDSTGTEWAAWDVVPRAAERRKEDRRVRVVPWLAEERRKMHRRVTKALRSVLPERLARGWLCFEAPAERRRLIPIPDDWASCTARRLEEYLRAATPVKVAPPR